MYYHVILELGDKYHKNAWDKTEIKSDIEDLNYLKAKFAEPYQIGSSILIDGRTIPVEHIERLRFFSSDEPSNVLEAREKSLRKAEEQASNIVAIGFYFNDLESAILKEKNITDELVIYAKGTKSSTLDVNCQKDTNPPTKVFIVHGHDDSLVNEVKSFLLSQSIDPVVLREQHDAGITIIEKLERYTKDSSIGFGIVLYTPDDEGKVVGTENYQFRARQNVVFEHGLLIGLYGREKVVSLVKKQSDIEMPGDVNGVIYTDHGFGDWRLSVAHMLDKANYNINYRKIT